MGAEDGRARRLCMGAVEALGQGSGSGFVLCDVKEGVVCEGARGCARVRNGVKSCVCVCVCVCVCGCVCVGVGVCDLGFG